MRYIQLFIVAVAVVTLFFKSFENVPDKCTLHTHTHTHTSTQMQTQVHRNRHSTRTISYTFVCHFIGW